MIMFLGMRFLGFLSSFVTVFLPSPILSSYCGYLVFSSRASAVIFSKFSWRVWDSGVQLSSFVLYVGEGIAVNGEWLHPHGRGFFFLMHSKGRNSM